MVNSDFLTHPCTMDSSQGTFTHIETTCASLPFSRTCHLLQRFDCWRGRFWRSINRGASDEDSLEVYLLSEGEGLTCTNNHRVLLTACDSLIYLQKKLKSTLGKCSNIQKSKMPHISLIPLSCKLQNILIKASSLYAEVPNKTSYAYFLPMQILLSLKILPIYHVNQSKRKCRWKNQMRMSSNLRIASFWGSIYCVPESMIENLTNYPFNHYKGASSRHYLRFINAGPETQKG